MAFARIAAFRAQAIAALLAAAVAALPLAAGAQPAAASAPRAVDLPNRKDPLEGITTAGQPSEAQLAAAAKAGYKSVVDLRTPREDRGLDEPAVVTGLGMRYESLPVAGADGVTFANAKKLDALLATLERPVLIHCSTGNRAGALLALRAEQNGMDEARALELGKSAGLTALEPTVEQKLAVGHD